MAISRQRNIELNPLFFIPRNLVDVREENQQSSDYIYTANPEYIADDAPILQTPDAPVPNAPSGYTIVEQTIRTGSDGRVVVDVLLEFPDIGVYDIDVAVTPA